MTVAILDDINRIDNAVANGNMSVKLPVGPFAYDRFKLELGGDITKADFSKLVLRASGIAFQEYEDVADLEAMSAYYGQDINADEIAIHFLHRFWKHEADAIRLVAGAANLDSLTFDAKIGSSPATPVVKANGRFRGHPLVKVGTQNFDANRMGMVTKVRNFSRSLSGSGSIDITDIPTNQGLLSGLHIYDPSDVVTGHQVWRGRENVWNTAAASGGVARMQSEVKEGGRVPQTHWHHIDFSLANELGDELNVNGVLDFRLKLDYSGPGVIRIYPVYFGQVDGIRA